MRVLVVSNFYPPHSLGGYEQHCRDVVDGLGSRGHEVEVLSSTYGVGRPVREGHVERRLASRWDPRYGKPTRRKLLAEELDVNRAMRQTIARFQPDVVSVWNMLSIPYSLVATAERSGRPVVLHIDDNWPLRRDPWLSVWSTASHRWARLVKAAARPLVDVMIPTRIRFRERGVRWVFISKFLKQQHLSHGLTSDDAPVIYAGIPIERFQGRDAASAPPSTPPLRLLYAGSLTAAKGPDVAIRALGHLIQGGCRDVTLSIIGSGPDRAYIDSLKQSAEELGLGGQVCFRGPVTRDEMPAVYAGHDALLFTSVAQEGFPLTILEAMASGLAVVSSVTGGHAEILEDGRNALTYPAGDAEGLAQRIRTLLDQPALAGRLAQAGRKMVRQEFSVERMIDRNEDLFRELARQGARGMSIS